MRLKALVALGIAAVSAASLPIEPVDATARIVNFGQGTNISSNSIGVYLYASGSTRLFDVAADWAPGTFTNTTTNGAGDLQLSSVGAGFATTGSWESPVLSTSGPGTAAIYGLVRSSVTTSSSTTNLALGKTASMSSVDYSGFANFGNDGITSGVYGYAAGSVFHTAYEQGWWQVDLGSSVGIGTVRLWNRTDCCATRSNNLRVMVSPNPFPTAASLPAAYAAALVQPGVVTVTVPGAVGTPSTATFPAGTAGRYVRVWQPVVEFLHLAEVQVFPPTTTVQTQIAVATAPTGPWNYVGPDGTAATFFANGTQPYPYAADGKQYSRIKATLTGGSATPTVQSIQVNTGLTASPRTSGGTHAVSVATGSPVWVARLASASAGVPTMPASMALGSGSSWATTTLQVGFDQPATTCCGAAMINVVAGGASVTGTPAVNPFAAGLGASLSVVATRSDAIPSVGNITVRLAPSSSSRVEVPLSVSFP
jgi:hypothetical protein